MTDEKHAKTKRADPSKIVLGLLHELEWPGTMTLDELREVVRIPRSSLQRRIDTLVRNGFIERLVGENNKAYYRKIPGAYSRIFFEEEKAR